MDLAMTVGGWAMLAASRPSWGFWDESWAFPGVDPPTPPHPHRGLSPPAHFMALCKPLGKWGLKIPRKLGDPGLDAHPSPKTRDALG